jgi:hypothetical protein
VIPKWLNIIEQLRDRGIDFALGLSHAEIASVERRFDFRFPTDLTCWAEQLWSCERHYFRLCYDAGSLFSIFTST